MLLTSSNRCWSPSPISPRLLGSTYNVSVTLGVPMKISIRALLAALLVTLGGFTWDAALGLDSL
ncbi:hypothetical protein F7O96_32675 [Pseudomonas aeruginosa]|nr:hypothetical protein F7O96_32675 [Pseudomonas aeruginosa]